MRLDTEGPDRKGPWKELALTWVMEIQCRAFDRGIIININCLFGFFNCFFSFLVFFKRLCFKIIGAQEFTGSPAVRTQRFDCWGPDSISDLIRKIRFCKLHSVAKKEKATVTHVT